MYFAFHRSQTGDGGRFLADGVGTAFLRYCYVNSNRREWKGKCHFHQMQEVLLSDSPKISQNFGRISMSLSYGSMSYNSREVILFGLGEGEGGGGAESARADFNFRELP